MKSKDEARLVYSCTAGRICPQCQQPVAACCCRTAVVGSGDGTVRIRHETKGRKGKGVTVISGLLLPETELKALVQQLKKKCGSGGTLKQNSVEIQGDHCTFLIDYLSRQGWTVKHI